MSSSAHVRDPLRHPPGVVPLTRAGRRRLSSLVVAVLALTLTIAGGSAALAQPGDEAPPVPGTSTEGPVPDPAFDAGPVAAAPGCVGRSGATQYVEVPLVDSPYIVRTKAYLALSECDTQDVVQRLERGALAAGACALAFKGVGAYAPSTVKPVTNLGELVCGGTGIGAGIMRTALVQADQNGGGCGVVISFTLTFSNLHQRVAISSLRVAPRPCPSGVQPKAELGSVYVAAAGSPAVVDWTTVEYDRLPDLDEVSTQPSDIGPADQEHTAVWLDAPATTLEAPGCSPIAVSVPLSGLGADQATVESVTGADALAHGRLDPQLFVDSVGQDVRYTPTSDGEDTITYTVRNRVSVTSSVTIRVTGCSTGEPEDPASDTPPAEQGGAGTDPCDDAVYIQHYESGYAEKWVFLGSEDIGGSPDGTRYYRYRHGLHTSNDGGATWTDEGVKHGGALCYQPGPTRFPAP